MRRYLPWILLAVAALFFVLTHLSWMRQLPERPATHFDMQGRPDGWMDRSSHLVFMLLFGLGTPAFVITLCWALRFLPPSLLNVPKPEYWRSPEHYPEACRILLRWSVWLAVFMLVLMTFEPEVATHAVHRGTAAAGVCIQRRSPCLHRLAGLAFFKNQRLRTGRRSKVNTCPCFKAGLVLRR